MTHTLTPLNGVIPWVKAGFVFGRGCFGTLMPRNGQPDRAQRVVMCVGRLRLVLSLVGLPGSSQRTALRPRRCRAPARHRGLRNPCGGGHRLHNLLRDDLDQALHRWHEHELRATADRHGHRALDHRNRVWRVGGRQRAPGGLLMERDRYAFASILRAGVDDARGECYAGAVWRRWGRR